MLVFAMINNVVCPHCGKQVEISEALAHEMQEQVLVDAKKKYQAELDETIGKYVSRLTEKEKEFRELKRKDEERSLEMEKKISEMEEKVRKEASLKAEEGQHLKLLELQKQLTDALKVNKELQQKLEQGSQQNQGEVMELELETLLRTEFPNDKITPVAKGIRGADVEQEVWDRNGTRCGVILWESKNAKWSDGWIDKLKEDQRALKAELAVIVSENLPADVKVASYKDGVWVAQRNFATGIAMALRANLIQASYIRRSVTGKNEKMEVLYSYLSGVEFKQRLEAIVEAFTVMQEEMEKERRWFANKWAKQEKSIRGVLDNTSGMHGDLQAIMGASLPEIKSLTGV